jgi:WhiB family redox-sensing transcriptional regulator
VIDTRHLPGLDPVYDWKRRAECRDANSNLMYPLPSDLDGIRDAKKVCGGCPVRKECLAWALNHPEPYGVWGGLDERERADLLGRRPKPDPDEQPVRDPAVCGTEAGHRRHIRAGERACRRCKDARNRARAARRRQGRPP